MKRSPVNLENYFFPLQLVEARADHIQDGPTNTAFHVELSHGVATNDSGLYMVSITVETDDENSSNPPYQIKLTAMARFTVADNDLSDDEVTHALLANGGVILIGAARERISSLTSRSPWGMLVLPPLSLKIGAVTDKENGN